MESILHKGRFLAVVSDKNEWCEKAPSTFQEAMKASRPDGQQVTMRLVKSQKQLWSFCNGELMPTGDEFAFGTIRKNAEFYLSELFSFEGEHAMFFVTFTIFRFKMHSLSKKTI